MASGSSKPLRFAANDSIDFSMYSEKFDLGVFVAGSVSMLI